MSLHLDLTLRGKNTPSFPLWFPLRAPYYSAWNLVRFLRKLADQGQAILCTIHQPSSLLFESFDRLLLLERGGETVYFGDIGQDSRIIREYFARHGAHCPPNVNPAEYMLEAIGAGVTPRIGYRDWKDVWLDSQEFQQVREEINAIKQVGLSRPESDSKSSGTCTFARTKWCHYPNLFIF